MVSLVLGFVAVVIGGAIGYGFGSVQRIALRKHKKMQDVGKLSSGWLLIPGSMTRVALLIVVLVVVQLLLPFLFKDSNIPWFMSGGTVIGYGWTLLRAMKGVTSSAS